MAVFGSFRKPWWFSSLLLPVLLLLLWPTPTIQKNADDPVYVTVTATSGGPDTINVEWTLDNSVSSKVDAYNVTLTGGGSYDNAYLYSNTTNYTFTDLVPCTNYTVRVQPKHHEAIRNSVEVGGPGVDSTITDAEDLAAPSNIEVIMMEGQSECLRATWTQAQTTGRCDVTNNIVSWRRNNSSDTADFIKIPPSEDYIITGLKTWTPYIVCVKAAHFSFESTRTCDTETTDEDIPGGPPQNVKVMNTTTETITLSWEPPDNPNGAITYDIAWTPDDNGGTNTTTETKFTISKLQTCTNYTITVAATNTKGSNTSEEIQQNISPVDLAAPSNIEVIMMEDQSESLHATWTQAQTTGRCDVTSNIVSWRRNHSNDTADLIELPPAEDYIITSLKPWTTYIVCVKAAHLSFESNLTCDTETTDEDTPGPPINTFAEPESSFSIIVSWEPPIIPNGILTGYTVRWSPESNDGTDGEQLMDNNTFSYTVTNLTECTLYNICVFPATNKGNTTTPGVVQTSTETEDPPPPRSISCQYPEAHKLTVDWTNSTSVCPVIRYLIHYQGQVLWSNNTDTDDTVTNVTSVNLEHLIAWTTYFVCVKAQILDGKQSDNKCCMETTDQAAPGKPGSLNKTGSDTNSISFTWTPPDQLNGNLTGYQITWGSSRKNITDPKETSTKISGLKAGTTYTIEVQGITKGGIGKAIVEDMSTKFSNTGVIVGAVVGSLLLIVLLVLAFVYRNKFREVPTKQGKSSSKLVHSASYNRAARPPVPPRPAHIALAPVPKPNWEDGEVGKHEIRLYIQHLEENSQRGLEEEFMKVRDLSPQYSSHAATRDFNNPKNRWVNILPFDHSRVKLPLLPNQPGSDYINANYIMDANNKYHFIATQGPKDNTVNDLWRMVWELKVYTVVMLTNIKEGGKNKCAQYWPLRTDPPLNTGTFTVTNQEEENNTDYTLRYLMLNVGGQRRVVKQYHFTSWPDFSTPEHEHQLLDFVKTVQDESLKESQVIVHCSAGVGRTGTFIGLWNLIDILERNGSAANVNVRKTVVAMRECRTTMIQSQEQLLYLWKCVAAYLDTPDKWRPNDAYGSYDNAGYNEPIYDNVK